MARGNKILVNGTDTYSGKFTEGYVGAGLTFYPGMVVQKDPSVALKGGRHTYGVYDRAADGANPKGAHWIVLANNYIGLTSSDSYAAGGRVFLYAPLPGDELNLLVANLAGTADDHALGEMLMIDDGTGMLIATTGTPQHEVALLLEAITDPTANTLAWIEWAG